MPVVIYYYLDQVEYRRCSDSSFSLLLTSNNHFTYIATGLSPEARYLFKVAAIITAGYGTYIDFVTYTTLGGFNLLSINCNTPMLLCIL